jgi:pyruvate dehydrogenase E1 component
MNENYAQPAMPAGVEEGIVRGMYCLQREENAQAQLLGSGTILREVEAAAVILREQFKLKINVWSVTSFNELRREGLEVERWNRLHPTATPRVAYVQSLLADTKGPVVAATDYVKLYADQIRQWMPNYYEVLGTDGFGRSDTRAQLRRHFRGGSLTMLRWRPCMHLQQRRFAMAVQMWWKKRAIHFGIPADKPSPLYS